MYMTDSLTDVKRPVLVIQRSLRSEPTYLQDPSWGGFNENNPPPQVLRISYVPDPQYFTCINHLILTTALWGHCYDSPIVQKKLGGFTAIKQKSEVKVTQSHPTLCNPMDYTFQEILQARILEWVAIPSSRGSSQPRDQTQISHIAGRFSISWAAREAH